MRTLAAFLARLDRRVIFTLVAIACIAPLIRPLGLPLKPAENSKTVFNLIDNLKAGDTILMSFDYDPASAPELDPMARRGATASEHPHRLRVGRRDRLSRTVLPRPLPTPSGRAKYRQGLRRRINVGTHEPTAPSSAWAPARRLKRDMGSSRWSTAEVVSESKPLSEYPITKNVRTYRDLALVFSLTTGEVGITKYIQVAKTQFQTVVTGGCTAVTALELYPYLNSKQLAGLLEGMKGGADYEFMTAIPGPRPASQAMESHSVVHLLVIGFILVANFIHYVEKRHGLGN
jgi:hypothetical protein